jgi:hypothetical protein
MVFYTIKFRPTRTITATSKYGHRRFLKGKTYTVRRKMTSFQRKNVRNTPGSGIISVKKIKR